MIAPIQLYFQLNLSELNPIFAGEGSCKPGEGHVNMRSNFDKMMIHHIRKGKGTFTIGDTTHHLSAGQAFLIKPGETATYFADYEDPWEYAWIGFDGTLSYHFSALPNVFTMPPDGLRHLKNLRSAPASLPYLLTSDLFHLYGKLLQPQIHENDYIRAIHEYISRHYMEKISVEDFAVRYNMDRRHLSKQFKQKTGYSIRAYITLIRLHWSRDFIYRGATCKEAAQQCGFTNTANYYKMFKSYFGKTPMEWKHDRMRDLSLSSDSELPKDLLPPEF